MSVLYCHSDIGVKSLDFLNFWRICAVCVYNTICAEAVITCSVLKITAICKNFLPVIIYHFNCLVDIVPNKSALICLIFIFKVCIEMQSAERISHCVHIFTIDIWTLFTEFQIFFNFLRLCIHSAFHICNMVIDAVRNSCYTLIMNKSCRIHTSEIIGYCCNIITAIGFIATRPYQYTCMILITLIH